MDLCEYWQTVWTIQPSSLVQHGHGGQGFCPGQFNVLYLPQNDSLPTERCRILQPRSPAKQTETQPSAPTPVVSLTLMHTRLGECEPCSAHIIPAFCVFLSRTFLRACPYLLVVMTIPPRSPSNRFNWSSSIFRTTQEST